MAPCFLLFKYVCLHLKRVINEIKKNGIAEIYLLNIGVYYGHKYLKFM